MDLAQTLGTAAVDLGAAAWLIMVQTPNDRLIMDYTIRT